MNTIIVVICCIYLSLGILGLVAGAFASRFRASGERALKLSSGVAVLPLLAWHRAFGDPVLILALSLFSFSSPVALAYGFRVRRLASDRGLAWTAFILSIVVFGESSPGNVDEGAGLFESGGR